MTPPFRVVVFAISLMCSCADAIADCNLPRSGRIALERSDIAFRGHVREVGLPRNASGGWIGTVVTFAVSSTWKGAIGSEFVLYIVPESAEDVVFEPGLDYLVFATSNPPPVAARFNVAAPTFAARGCSGTMPILWATKYLIDIGAGRPPVTASRIPDPRTLQ